MPWEPLIPFNRRCQSRWVNGKKGVIAAGEQCHNFVPEGHATGCGKVKGHDDGISPAHPLWALLSNPDHPMWAAPEDWPLWDPSHPIWQLPPHLASAGLLSLKDRMAQQNDAAEEADRLRHQIRDLGDKLDIARARGYGRDKDGDDSTLMAPNTPDGAEVLDLEDGRPATRNSGISTAPPGQRSLKQELAVLKAQLKRQSATHAEEKQKLENQLKGVRNKSEKLMTLSYSTLDALDLGYKVSEKAPVGPPVGLKGLRPSTSLSGGSTAMRPATQMTMMSIRPSSTATQRFPLGTAKPMTAMSRGGLTTARTAVGTAAPGTAPAVPPEDADALGNNLDNMIAEMAQMLTRLEAPPPPPKDEDEDEDGSEGSKKGPRTPGEKPLWVPPGVAGMYPAWFSPDEAALMLGQRADELKKKRNGGGDDDTYYDNDTLDNSF